MYCTKNNIENALLYLIPVWFCRQGCTRVVYLVEIYPKMSRQTAEFIYCSHFNRCLCKSRVLMAKFKIENAAHTRSLRDILS